MNFDTLECTIHDQIAHVWLNRPDVHNAFNATVIAELHACFDELDGRDDVRVVVLGGRGKSFSAGADLTWMKQMGEADFNTNSQDALKLAKMLHRIATLTKPTIARVHGAALGGGMGLASACDICVASSAAKFATSEVRLGLSPSTISPYVIKAIGARQAGRYFLTAERIDAKQAHAIGLVHEVTDDEMGLDALIDDLIDNILKGAPKAQHASKELIDMVAHADIDDELLQKTANHIAKIRTGDEAKSGLGAFLSKQTPTWIK
ncbi:enoyl-CoA hydratase/isomerase family protein [Moraxella haemolytica]|uniref:enoyl-CoA hydratase/isomerase family protein n=2 Tax=Moraxella TaxID=475 RepID=UPI0025436F8D|nr:enoyl-CoA hydratase/isomerase family protein [Moraxella sp. ZY171148]WII95269.1 enoyl-CoA hydratase/isomerase family protein [Moraxella sp. ZY171148]